MLRIPLRIMCATIRRTAFWIVLFSAAVWGAQLRQVGIIDIPGPPGFDEAVFANGMLVLSHAAGDRLDVFDPARRRLVAQVTGLASPRGLAVDARNQLIWVANSGARNLAVVSAKEWKVERTVAVDAEPYALALSGDGLLFAANWQQRSLTVLNTQSGERSMVELGGAPAGLVYDGARRRLYVTLQDAAEIAVFDVAAGRVSSRFKVQASQPTAIALDAGRLYVAARGAIVALNADDGTELSRAKAPTGVDALWIDQAGGWLFAAAASGAVSVYRADASLGAVEDVRTEVRGDVLAYDPARQSLYLAGGREGRSKLLILKKVAPTAGAPTQMANR